MKIRNTCNHDRAEVCRLIEFVQQHSLADLSKTSINVKNAHGYAIAGRAYSSVPKISQCRDDEAENLVVLKIGDDGYFPHSNLRKIRNKKTGKITLVPYGGKGSPEYECLNWQEGLVALAAHEFQHIYQFQKNFPRSECGAEKAALKTLESFRQV